MATNDLNPFKEDHLGDSSLETQQSAVSSSRFASSSINFASNKDPSSSIDSGISPAQNQAVYASSNDPSVNRPVNSGGIDPQKVKMFLVMLAKACKRHEIRLQAHHEFHEHLHKIKSSMTTEDYDQSNLNSDLEELKKKVSHLISVEKNPAAPMGGKYNQERIALLESKINKLMQSKMERDERFEQLETRINTKLDADKQMIDAMERKLLILQKKLLEKRMNSRSAKNKQGIDILRKQIQKTQDALEGIKSRQKTDSGPGKREPG